MRPQQSFDSLGERRRLWDARFLHRSVTSLTRIDVVTRGLVLSPALRLRYHSSRAGAGLAMRPTAFADREDDEQSRSWSKRGEAAWWSDGPPWRRAVVDASGYGGDGVRRRRAFRLLCRRSAVKALQALPLVESGAADRLGLTPSELALACASHSGEYEHVATARAMLAKAGRDAHSLECGRPLAARRSRRPSSCARRRDAHRAAQQLFGEARGLHLLRLRRGDPASRLCRAGSPGPARGYGGARGHNPRNAQRRDTRDRRLFDPDLRNSAARARIRLRPFRDRAGASAATGERSRANPRRCCCKSLDRGRREAVRHGDHHPPRRARLQQDRR